MRPPIEVVAAMCIVLMIFFVYLTLEQSRRYRYQRSDQALDPHLEPQAPAPASASTTTTGARASTTSTAASTTAASSTAASTTAASTTAASTTAASTTAASTTAASTTAASTTAASTTAASTTAASTTAASTTAASTTAASTTAASTTAASTTAASTTAASTTAASTTAASTTAASTTAASTTAASTTAASTTDGLSEPHYNTMKYVTFETYEVRQRAINIIKTLLTLQNVLVDDNNEIADDFLRRLKNKSFSSVESVDAVLLEVMKIFDITVDKFNEQAINLNFEEISPTLASPTLASPTRAIDVLSQDCFLHRSENNISNCLDGKQNVQYLIRQNQRGYGKTCEDYLQTNFSDYKILSYNFDKNKNFYNVVEEC